MQFDSRTFLGGVLLCLVVLTITGCNDGPATVSVEGVVTLDGQPLEGATVLFEPEIGAKPAVGTTDAAGKFTLTAYVGSNGVAVAKGIDLAAGSAPAEGAEGDETEEDDGSGEEFLEDVNELETPPKYASARTSGINIDVQDGMAPVTLELKSGQ